MARRAANRDTYLTPAEIAAEALRQSDAGAEPSVRGLAAALRVAPATIYYHYPSRAAILKAAVELVWGEATEELLSLVPRPFEADPAEVLVASGLATRRAWLSHHRLARYLAATPEANQAIRASLGLMASVFERLGLEGEEAARAFHAYASFMFGAVLFAADRATADQELEPERAERANGRPRFHSEPPPGAVRRSSKRTRLALDDVMDVSRVDPARDEELFADDLRRLVATFR